MVEEIQDHDVKAIPSIPAGRDSRLSNQTSAPDYLMDQVGDSRASLHVENNQLAE